MSTDHGSPPIPPEPKTPSWLTALGAVLFLSVALWWILDKIPAGGSVPSSFTGPSTTSDAGAH
jgi:hypothetical protein